MCRRRQAARQIQRRRPGARLCCGRGDRDGYVVFCSRSTATRRIIKEHLRYYAAEDDARRRRRGYFVEEVVEGAELLGRKSDDGQYHNVMVEEVTETGYKVLFTEFGDDEQNRAELPICCATLTPPRRRRRKRRMRRTATTTIVMMRPSPWARS